MKSLNDETRIALYSILADIYPSIEDSRRVVSESGIPSSSIAFDNKAINNWFEIVRVANLADKIPELVKIALKAAPTNPVLRQILDSGELSSVPAPSVEDLLWQDKTPADTIEKLMDSESTLLPISFLEVGLRCSLSVARVCLKTGELGSGFLTDDNIFVTNHHILRSIEESETAKIQFNYQTSINGLFLESTDFSLDPAAGFATSAIDDWTLVRIKGDANADWGAIHLSYIDDYEKIKYVNIIQHPSGGPKQIAMYHNIVAFADENRLQYLTDTLPGSSGSPVFDNQWRVVALHHSGGYIIEPKTRKTVYRNEGININLVFEALENQLL